MVLAARRGRCTCTGDLVVVGDRGQVLAGALRGPRSGGRCSRPGGCRSVHAVAVPGELGGLQPYQAWTEPGQRVDARHRGRQRAAIGASTSDSYAWKKFASDSSSTGNLFLAITYTTDGAATSWRQRPPDERDADDGGVVRGHGDEHGASTWTTSNGYQMGSVAYNAQGGEVSNSLVYTPMPSTVAPGQSVTVDVKVGRSGPAPTGSSSGCTRLPVVRIAGHPGLRDRPVRPAAAAGGDRRVPPTGYTSTTLQQQLSTTATGTGTVTYAFTLTCEPLSGQTCTDATVPRVDLHLVLDAAGGGSGLGHRSPVEGRGDGHLQRPVGDDDGRPGHDRGGTAAARDHVGAWRALRAGL